jgi:hypothetical protein
MYDLLQDRDRGLRMTALLLKNYQFKGSKFKISANILAYQRPKNMNFSHLIGLAKI